MCSSVALLYSFKENPQSPMEIHSHLKNYQDIHTDFFHMGVSNFACSHITTSSCFVSPTPIDELITSTQPLQSSSLPVSLLQLIHPASFTMSISALCLLELCNTSYYGIDYLAVSSLRLCSNSFKYSLPIFCLHLQLDLQDSGGFSETGMSSHTPAAKTRSLQDCCHLHIGICAVYVNS